MKDFDTWNEVKKKVEESKRIPVKAGEICWCKIGINVGTEEDGKGSKFTRPILIMKKYSHQSILVAPLTTKSHTGSWYYDLNFKDKALQVILNQARPIDTKRLFLSMGQVSEKELEKIINAYCNLVKS